MFMWEEDESVRLLAIVGGATLAIGCIISCCMGMGQGQQRNRRVAAVEDVNRRRPLARGADMLPEQVAEAGPRPPLPDHMPRGGAVHGGEAVPPEGGVQHVAGGYVNVGNQNEAPFVVEGAAIQAIQSLLDRRSQRNPDIYGAAYDQNGVPVGMVNSATGDNNAISDQLRWMEVALIQSEGQVSMANQQIEDLMGRLGADQRTETPPPAYPADPPPAYDGVGHAGDAAEEDLDPGPENLHEYDIASDVPVAPNPAPSANGSLPPLRGVQHTGRE